MDNGKEKKKKKGKELRKYQCHFGRNEPTETNGREDKLYTSKIHELDVTPS
jgi:hypothetical protein